MKKKLLIIAFTLAVIINFFMSTPVMAKKKLPYKTAPLPPVRLFIVPIIKIG